jgi:hypothetical protein
MCLLLLLLLFVNSNQARFWTEVYDGAKLFYLSGMQHGKYLKREVRILAGRLAQNSSSLEHLSGGFSVQIK